MKLIGAEENAVNLYDQVANKFWVLSAKMQITSSLLPMARLQASYNRNTIEIGGTKANKA